MEDTWQRQTRMATQERRKARRFALDIPAIFCWGGNDGQARCEGAGFCRDISTSGVFVIAFSTAPPVDRRLDLMVLLPPLNPRVPAMRLSGTGTVVRVERMEDRIGLGIASSFGDIERSGRAASLRPAKENAVPCS